MRSVKKRVFNHIIVIIKLSASQAEIHLINASEGIEKARIAK